MNTALDLLTPSAHTLYNALLSLRGKRVCVQVERLSTTRQWATVRGLARFDEDLSVLVNHGLVILDREYDELQLLTLTQSESAAVFAAAEREWPAHLAYLESAP